MLLKHCKRIKSNYCKGGCFRGSSSKDYIKCSCVLPLLSFCCPKVATVNYLPEIFFIYKHLLGHRL